MTQVAISDFSTTPASNTDNLGIGILGTSLVSTADDAFRSLDAMLAGYSKDLAGIGQTVGGSANAITLTTAQPWAALANGLVLAFKNTVGPNTSAVTLAVTNSVAASLGTKAIRLQGDTALVGGELVANGIYLLRYDTSYNSAAGAWVLLNSAIPVPLSLSQTAAGTILTLTSLDAGATSGPNIDLYRNSASAAVNDLLALLQWNGQNSTPAKVSYASIYAGIVSPTAGAEGGSLAFSTTLAGTNANRLLIGAGLYTPNATGGDKGVDSFNAATYYKNGSYGVITQGTVSTATGGTAISFTSVIPPNAKHFVLTFGGISGSGTSIPIVQLGVGGVYQGSAYLGTTGKIATSTASSFQWSTGVPLTASSAAADVMGGTVTGDLLNAATGAWTLSVVCGLSSSTTVSHGAGHKVLADTLDSVRLTFVNGTDTFDANVAVNLSWE